MPNYFDQNEIINEWEKFKVTVKEAPDIRPVTLEAWERCRLAGLEPDKLEFKFLNENDLEQKLQQNSFLIEISRPYLSHLSLSLTGIPHIIALSDSKGWIIDLIGTPEILGGKESGFWLGSCWSEKVIGNNGIGTALSLGKPVFVYGKEHFSTLYGSFACIGVPIKNKDKIIGAIDISVPNEYGHPDRLNLAVACASSIETTIINTSLNPLNDFPHSMLSATSELIAAAVHDLKNPLSVIRGLGELGKITSDDEKNRSYFDRIIKQTDELNNMVIELLSIFKPQELFPVKVVPVLQDILHNFEFECKSKGITLTFVPKCDKYVNMSETLFRRVIENLITNAMQIMDNGGTIEVIVKAENDFIIISIKDTAGGIPESIKDNLFEPFIFKRSDGTGLGLFMAYQAITITHKGQIWFDTQAGLGTTFYIKLPIFKKV